jgi:hypothetical protein
MKCVIGIACCGLLAPAFVGPLRAEPGTKPPAEVAPAPQRWAADNSGGAPDFARHVQPLLGKLGCSGRACHGSFQGQGGFRLSLFGSDPAADYQALKARIDAKDTGKGPLLLKPTRQTPHRGAKRFDADGWEYRLLKAWTDAGAPYKPAREPVVARLTVAPERAILAGRGETVRVKVVAHYPDGTKEDVTALTQFATNDEAVGGVADSGLVTAAGPGDTAVVATFGGSVATAQVLVPFVGTGKRPFEFPPNNPIDELVAAKWKALGLTPSDPSDDGTFLRRAALDLTGTLPTADEARKFLADPDPKKRAKKIDELLGRSEYAAYWATKFSDLTGNDSGATPPPRDRTAWLWHGWLRDKLDRNVPYDELVAGFVTATTREGRPVEGAVKEYRTVAADVMIGWAGIGPRPLGEWEGKGGFASAAYEKRKTNDLFWKTYQGERAALRVSYAFLGVRMECAQCHKHPYDRWTQDDFKGFTAFFDAIRVGVPDDVPADAAIPPGKDERTRELVYRYSEVYAGPPGAKGGKGAAATAKGAPVVARLPGGAEVPLEAGTDPRTALANWMRAPDNPFLAKALVNRLWAHYFGVGLVEPTDELSAANPPSNPELLDWLAKDFAARKFDLKHLHRTILNSRVYQLSWRPNEANATDERNYSHARLRRLPAETLVDAVNRVTGGREEGFRWKAKTYTATIAPDGTPAIGLAPTRLGQSPARYALEVFGRPLRADTCDRERSADVTLTQALYLLYDDDVNRKVRAPEGRLAKLLKDTPDDGRVVEELYLSALGRYPTATETKKAVGHVAKAADRRSGFEDVLWAVLNLREFVFNR